MCDHRLSYHSEHKHSEHKLAMRTEMTVYCYTCGAQWIAVMFIGPHGPDEPPPFLDQPEPPVKTKT